MQAFDPNRDKIDIVDLNDDFAAQIRAAFNHLELKSYHVSNEDRERWDGKLVFGDTDDKCATQDKNGLMHWEDKVKLDEIAERANFYTHPESTVVPGTYNNVTVDEFGHVIAGHNNPVGDAATLDGKDLDYFAPIVSPVFQGTPILYNTPVEGEQYAVTNVQFVMGAIKNILAEYGIGENTISGIVARLNEAGI